MTFIIAVAATLTGIILGICLALRGKGIVPLCASLLGKVTVVTNILMLVVYTFLVPVMWFIAALSEPSETGFLGVLGWFLCILNSVPPLFCGAGLGFSVLLRKKEKYTAAFFVQFAGIAAFACAITLYACFVGTLLTPLN